MIARNTLLPAAALGLSASLLAGCAGPESPAPEDMHTGTPVPITTEQAPEHSSITMGDVAIRVIQAEDSSSKAAGPVHQVATANIMSRAGLLAQQSTNEQWQPIFGTVERVTLGYAAGKRLCAASANGTWSETLKTVRKDVLEAAGDPQEDFDTTLVSYGFKTCQPRTRTDHGDGRVPGEAVRRDKVVDLPRGPNSAKFVLHQLGHYYGLGHARLNTCNQEGAGGYCFKTRNTYADPSNVMGATLRPDKDAFNSPQLYRTGVLDADQIIDVKRSGTFTLGSLVGSSDRPRVLRIPKADGDAGQKYYYVELSGGTSHAPQGDSLKVYGAPDMQNPPTEYPSTVLYKLGDGPEVGATRARQRQVFAGSGLRLFLRKIIQNSSDEGSTAEVRVELTS